MQNLLTTPAQAKAIMAKLVALGFNPTAVGKERTEGPWEGPIMLTKLESEPPDSMHQFGFVFAPNPGPSSGMYNAASLRDGILERPNTSPDLKWQMLFASINNSWDYGAFSAHKANTAQIRTLTDNYATSILGD